jgi:phosphoglycerol geranylgeranyltransferase
MKFSKLVRKLGSGKPMLAVLIDPDKFNRQLISLANECRVHCFLVGGSALKTGDVSKTVRAIKRISKIPVVLFPGDETQLCAQADGLLLLSLLSGRNPDYLIEKHITAAPIIKKMKLKHLSTAYLLIDGGKASATQKVTGTKPLDPGNRSYIINTAIAAEQLGFKALYLEAGSGALRSVNPKLLRDIKKNCTLPVIVGGGIDSAERVMSAISAGANMVVVGNALEKDAELLRSISACF